MTEANSRNWKREGAKEDLRIDDFWVEDDEVAEPFEVAVAVGFLLITGSDRRRSTPY